MFVLFDQGTPLGIRGVLSQHTVKTAKEQGWSTLQNGELLRVAEQAGFDGQNRWRLIQMRLAEIAMAVDHSKPGTVVMVEILAKT
jgi:hypothetical protein